MEVAEDKAESGLSFDEEYGLHGSTATKTGVTDSSKQAWGSGQIGCAIVAIIGLLLFIASLFSGGSGGSSEVSAPHHSSLDAYAMCKQFLEDRLKAPKTADYPLESYRDVTESLGGGKYRVQSYVDAQNSFGAMIRTHYDCTVQWLSGDRWKLEDLRTY